MFTCLVFVLMNSSQVLRSTSHDIVLYTHIRLHETQILLFTSSNINLSATHTKTRNAALACPCLPTCGIPHRLSVLRVQVRNVCLLAKYGNKGDYGNQGMPTSSSKALQAGTALK
jgi:hypothetical protein